MNTDRPHKSISTAELELELALRAGPRYQCQNHDCRSLETTPGEFDTCPACGRQGLCGTFERNTESPEWKDWEQRTVAMYRKADTKRAEIAIIPCPEAKDASWNAWFSEALKLADDYAMFYDNHAAIKEGAEQAASARNALSAHLISNPRIAAATPAEV